MSILQPTVTHKSPMKVALGLARDASNRSEVPVGAVIVNTTNGKIIAQTSNRMEEDKDPTAHAELLAIKEATIVCGQKLLESCDIYVTLEPCAMCAAAISLARIRRLYFAAYDPKSGGVEHGAKVYDHVTCHHKPEIIGGINEEEAAELLKKFFKNKR